MNSNGVYTLNSFTWKVLEMNLGWTTADYDGARPIIPTSQQPEFLSLTKPFLVYGSSAPRSAHLYALKNESVAYTVWGTSISEVNKVVDILASVFEQQDEAAAAANEWIDVERAGRSIDRGISFATIHLSMVQRAEPAEQEGGFYKGFLIVDIKYTNSFQPELTGFTYP